MLGILGVTTFLPESLFKTFKDHENTYVHQDTQHLEWKLCLKCIVMQLQEYFRTKRCWTFHLIYICHNYQSSHLSSSRNFPESMQIQTKEKNVFSGEGKSFVNKQKVFFDVAQTLM